MRLTKYSLPVFYLFALLLVSYSCQKGKDTENTCGSLGGVVSPNRYLFWINYNPACGYIAVEVKDADGKIITPFQGKVMQSSSVPPECSNTNYGKYATFDLYQGKTYTYKATCTGKSWIGTFTVSCEQNQCKNIQLQ
ncbi:hypothetical protein [Niastella populi]|uniref:Uncharacterized protein n=1 Tax=Niastella populi TaxID=550983 RepID=A0A1V9ESD1_9BACT|nr:hypothetical protein [Niastella populi]OQP49073.1 hypothetical protein A4R26_31160 [Niastella populi]